MDAYFLSSGESDGFSCLKGELDKNIESTLRPLVKRNRGRIGKLILAGYTKATLLAARKKLFNIAVRKEEERRSIVKDFGDANANVSLGRAAALNDPPETWRLVDRRSKPKTVEDIVNMVLHMKGQRETFPSSVLKKPAEKRKEVVVCTDVQPVVDWAAATSEDEKEENDSESESESEPEFLAPDKDQKCRLEKLTISEVFCIDFEGNLSDKPQVPKKTRLEKLTISEVFCIDIQGNQSDKPQVPSTRTFATQTIVQDKVFVSVDAVTVDASKAIAPAHRGESTNLDTASTGEAKGANPDDSILEYIDEEFEALKNSGVEMSSLKRKCPPTSEDPKRLDELERKYEYVVKKLDRVAKKHEADMRMVRAELAEVKDNPNSGRSPPIVYGRQMPSSSGTRERRHSDSELKSPTARCELSLGDPLATSEVADSSVWDFNEGDVFICTQDSQGNPVSTRATPLHMREKVPAKNACSCACANAAMDDNKTLDRVDKADSGVKPRNTRQTSTRKDEMPQNNENRRPPAKVKAGGAPAIKQYSAAPDIRPSTSYNPPREQREPRMGKPGAAAKQINIRPSILKQTTQKEMPRPDDDNSKRRKIDTTCTTYASGSARQASNQSCNNESEGKSPVSSISSISSNDDECNDSYAEKVTKYQWKTATGSKNSEKGKKGPYPAIKSAAHSKNKEMYVRGMSCGDFRAYRDLEEAVRLYCKERDVITVFQRVIIYNKENDSVGIKVVVRECDVAKFSSRGFWPDGISVREWSDDKPTARDRFFRNDKSSSDESH